MNFDRLSQFALKPALSDFTITLPEKISKNPVTAHRIVLAANSKKFNDLFTQDTQLTEYKLPIPVNSIEGETTEDFILAILRFGYDEQTINKLIDSGLTESNVFRFYSAAKILDFNHAKELLENFIEQRNFVEENYVTCLYESIKFEQEEWVFKLIQLISTCFNSFINTEGGYREKIISLPFDHIKALLNRDDLMVENEDKVFTLVIDYLKFREELEEKEGALDLAKEEEEKEGEEPKEEPEKVEESTDTDDLEKKAQLLLTNYKLSNEEKKELLNLVRLKFVSHTVLINAVKEDILGPFKDMILEAISAKLSVYENTNTDYSITLQPRDCYSDEKLKTVSEIHRNYKTLPQEPVKLENTNTNKGNTYNPMMKKPANFMYTEGNIREIEMNQSDSNRNNFLDDSVRPQKKATRMEFNFNYNFDENGVFYWLGTKGKTAKYVNPYSSGEVKVFFSSISDKCRYDTFVGRNLENCRTGNQMNSYMGVDLGKNR